MSKWASDTPQRRSKRYAALHEQLRMEVNAYFIIRVLPIIYDTYAVLSDKSLRKRRRAQEYRQQGQA